MKVKIIALTVSFLLILSIFAGCRKISDNPLSSNTSDIMSDVYGIVDVVEDFDSDTESADSTVTDDIQSDIASSINNTSSTNSTAENVVSVGDTDAPLTFVEADPENPDSSVNSGSATEGYDKVTFSTSPKAKTGDVVTVKIAPNGSVYYKIKGVSNKILTIKNENAYVVYNGTRYDAKNGVVTFTVVSNELANAQILFEVGNKGATADSFTINFVSPLGSRDNPEVLDSISDSFNLDIPEGNDQGYFYKYTATESGKIRFYILSDANSGKLSVDKIIDAKLLVVQQRATTDTGEDYVKTDDKGTYIEFDVQKDDEFTINAAPNSNLGEYPAVTINWTIKYE